MDSSQREQSVSDLIEKCGYAAAALTLIPIPGSEIVLVMPIHVGMVVEIGHIYEVELTRDSAQELIVRIGATVGMSLIGSRLAGAASKFVPIIGSVISASFMYASTLAIGAVVRAYFAQGGDLSNDEIKSVYNSTLKTAKKNFDPKRARSSEAKDMARHATEVTDSEPEPVVKVSAPKPEPAKEAESDPVARLERLKSLLDKGLIDAAEYEATKQRILTEL